LIGQNDNLREVKYDRVIPNFAWWDSKIWLIFTSSILGNKGE